MDGVDSVLRFMAFRDPKDVSYIEFADVIASGGFSFMEICT